VSSAPVPRISLPEAGVPLVLSVLQGRVEELLVAEELWNDHKKPFFFPFSSAATCRNHPLEVDQRFHVECFL
ncbi:hypothetical protein Taro_051542, partial [Colocasia esculenta]|nr:hypothetical protein [Colocasia esculenta]